MRWCSRCITSIGGKVDPSNSARSGTTRRVRSNVDRAYAVSRASLATGQIREALDEVRPQHVWYQRGRERLQEYRAIAAAGGWPAIPDGPSLKPGMSDARVPVLRRRLEITKDLPTLTAAKAPAATGDDRHLQARAGPAASDLDHDPARLRRHARGRRAAFPATPRPHALTGSSDPARAPSSTCRCRPVSTRSA